jgi:hypothetical protein
MDAAITNDTSRPAITHKPACWPWLVLLTLSAAAEVAGYFLIPSERFHGLLAGAFLTCIGLGFAFGGIGIYAILTRRHHA